MKIRKLENKEVKVVAGQKNCSKAGYSVHYGPDDCLNDCIRADKPRHWVTPTH